MQRHLRRLASATHFTTHFNTHFRHAPPPPLPFAGTVGVGCLVARMLGVAGGTPGKGSV